MSRGKMDTDWEGLMRQVQEGDKAAYNQLLNKLYSLLAQYLRHRVFDDKALISAFPDPENLEEDIHAKLEIEDYLNMLPARQQKLVQLVRLEGYSIKDAAQKLEMSVSNVKTSIHRALTSIKRNNNE